MSEEEKAYRRSELRYILGGVPIKSFIAALLVHYATSSDAGLFDKVIVFVMMYSALSIYAYVSKSVGNWILGLIVIFVGVWIFYELKLPAAVYKIFEVVFVTGGFALDTYRIIDYIKLSAPGKTNNSDQTK